MGMRFGAVGALLALCLGTACLDAVPVWAQGCPGELTQHPLPEVLEWARDVRWAGPEELFVSATTTGLFRWSLGKDAEPHLEIEAGNGSRAVWMTDFVAASESHLAVASPLFVLGWKRRGEESLGGHGYFEHVFDIDLYKDRLFVLATRKEEGVYAPDGAIGWTAVLGKTKPKPVFFSEDGAGAPRMNDCGLMGLGVSRFMPDGKLVLVPGIEQGVVLMDAEGLIHRTWQAEAVGFDAGCSMSPEMGVQVNADPEARLAWMRQRRIVDDVLPLPAGPGILVRTHAQDKTSWQLKVLAGDDVRTCEIPVTSSSYRVRMRGDVRGNKVVLLQMVHGPAAQKDAKPEVPARLWTAELREHPTK